MMYHRTLSSRSTSPLRAAALGVALSPLALAIQAHAADTETDLNTVVITGETLSHDLQNTATSVAVLTGEALENSSDVSLYDSFHRIANVTPIFGNKGFSIRGVTQSGPGGAGNGRTINIAIDGASLPTTQSTFFGPYNAWDLEQVEVLRGPQSTQQGRNALAGSINIRSADPEFEESAKMRFRAGNRDTTGIAFMYNTPLNDEFAVRVAGEHSQTDGWVINTTRDEDDYDAREMGMLRAKVMYEPSDDLNVVVSHAYNRNEGGEDYVQIATYPNRYATADHDGKEYGVTQNTGLRIRYNLNEAWTLASESTYFKNDYKRLEDYDNTERPTGFIDRDLNDTSWSQEFKLTFDDGGPLRGAAGLFATQIEALWDGRLQGDANAVDPRVPAGVAVFTRTIERVTDTDNIAVFGELDYDLNADWTLTAGARYDYEKIHVNDKTTYGLTPALIPLPPQDVVDQTTSFNAFLPKLGITYRWNDDVNTAFTVQRGYRAGGNDRNAFTLVAGSFDPEYTTNYELALRSRLLDGRMTLNGNLFYTDWKDQQVRVAGPSGNANDTYITNAGRSTLYGMEVEMAWEATDKLDLFASVGYTHTEFDDFKTGNTDFTGNEFPYAPKLSGSLGAEYRVAPNWFVQTDTTFLSRHHSEPDNDEAQQVPGRALLNARVGYETADWTVSLFARNLLDKDYITQSYVEGSNIRIVRTGEPLTAGLELTANF